MLLLLMVATGCGSHDPFRYVPVSGRITYEDGSPIVADYLRLTFIPQTVAANPKQQALAGKALVNPAAGTFDMVTSHTYGDGLVVGKHKVLVVAFDNQQRPTAAVPAEYGNVDQTPLLVDTADRPFTLLVKKPPAGGPP
jgi:hypothetical protein